MMVLSRSKNAATFTPAGSAAKCFGLTDAPAGLGLGCCFAFTRLSLTRFAGRNVGSALKLPARVRFEGDLPPHGGAYSIFDQGRSERYFGDNVATLLSICDTFHCRAPIYCAARPGRPPRGRVMTARAHPPPRRGSSFNFSLLIPSPRITPHVIHSACAGVLDSLSPATEDAGYESHAPSSSAANRH